MNPPLKFLLGPTASGKSALALALAAELDGEILSLDSMAIFRGMDIGTAKPNATERAQLPHHLIDLVDPWEEFNVAQYLDHAQAAIEDVRSRGKEPIFVGGTAFYFMALTQGLFSGPGADESLRLALKEEEKKGGEGTLHRRLAEVDPEGAAKIHFRDLKRVIRALEVWQLTGRPLSDQQTQWEKLPAENVNYLAAVLTREPDELKTRVRERITRMLADGLIQETETILAAGGFSRQASAALGYAQVVEMLNGLLPTADLEEKIANRTWNFVRKQRTWFRKLAGVKWVDPNKTQDPQGALREHYQL